MRTRWVCGIFALVAVFRLGLAADGTLDSTFGNYLPGVSKVAFDLGADNSDTATSLLVQTDGKLVLVGSADSSAGSRIAAARLMPGGSIDATFGTAGKFNHAPAGTNASALHAALQKDGKIVVVGTVTPISSSNSDFIVCRLTTAGALDGGFGSTGCTTIAFDLGLNTDNGRAIAIQSDGKIVVAGEAAGPSPGSGEDFAFARLDTLGIPDATFGFGGTGKQIVTRFAALAGAATYDVISAIAIQADGKIIGAGYTETLPGGSFNFAVARLDALGQIDASYGNGGVQVIAFDIGGSKNDAAESAVVQPDGHLLLAGYASFSATDTDYAFVRLDTSGALDTSFNTIGKRTVAIDLGGVGPDFARAVALQSDGKIVAVGHSYNSASGGVNDDDISAVRLQPGGGSDLTFGGLGKVAFGLNLGGGNFDRAYAVALQGGRIVLAGEVALSPAGNRDFVVLRLNNDLIFADGFGP